MSEGNPSREGLDVLADKVMGQAEEQMDQAEQEAATGNVGWSHVSLAASRALRGMARAITDAAKEIQDKPCAATAPNADA